MIIRMKVTDLRHLGNGEVEIKTQCEEFDKVLLQRSPNLLIDHLNKHYKLEIAYIKKGGRK